MGLPEVEIVNNTDENIVSFLQKQIDSKVDLLDFRLEKTDYSTHNYHDYPATMIPQLPKLFIESVIPYKKIETIFDPFAGSGTTLVESSLHNINSIGTDLNPLAVLMSRVKTTLIDNEVLETAKAQLYKNIEKERELFTKGKIDLDIPDFKNINYWFKEYIIIDLQIIKQQIKKISDPKIRDFFLTSFSMTTRFVSNTRNNEFKMYRMEPKKLETWEPDVFKRFRDFTDRNVEYNRLSEPMLGNVTPILGSSASVPNIPSNSFDMLITSPPYGDSKTTVAYGQFSRTSLQWLDLEELPSNDVPKLDSALLGGKLRSKELVTTKSEKLNQQLLKIAEVDYKRALEVSQFYQDLYMTLKEIKRVMKPDSYQFWVTANRTVKGVNLTTDEIITELYQTLGVKKIAQFSRHIPNKRMPSKNSPTNIKGKVISTMNKENIVVYKTL